GQKFYALLSEANFYDDGVDTLWGNRFTVYDGHDCRELKYLDKDRAIDIGVDFGNMMSMCIGQENMRENVYRVLKFMYTLTQDWIKELAANFKKYFQHQKGKTVHRYYDRAGNNYKKAGQDLASELKDAIEFDIDDKGNKVRSGWHVIPMSLNQGNIPQNEEYNFMQKFLGGHVKKLPKLLIDFYQCKELRASLELSRTKTVQLRNGTKVLVKNKTSEKMKLEKLPMESTNPSDSFKYLVMRPVWRKIIQVVHTIEVGRAEVR